MHVVMCGGHRGDSVRQSTAGGRAQLEESQRPHSDGQMPLCLVITRVSQKVMSQIYFINLIFLATFCSFYLIFLPVAAHSLKVRCRFQLNLMQAVIRHPCCFTNTFLVLNPHPLFLSLRSSSDTICLILPA